MQRRSEESIDETVLGLIGRDDAGTALVDPDAGFTLSYEALHESVDRVARQLVSKGVAPGDVVALCSFNDLAFVVTFLAVVSLGASAAPLNPAYTATEFRSYLDDLQPARMLFVGDAGAAARPVCGELGIAVSDVVGADAATVELQGGAQAAAVPPADADAVALLLHTSGTTSQPKGVPLRQRNLHASARAIARGYALSAQDVSHCVMPLFHVHGLVASVLAPLSTGGTVLIPRRFSASAFWRESRSFGATWFSAVPTIHHILLRDADGDRPRHELRFVRSCSAALPASTWRDCEELYGVPVVEAYGMTEASHQMASNPLPPADRRPGTVGLPTGVEVAIVNEAWSQLQLGNTGEVVVRGPSVIGGYRNNPEANAASFSDGWFRTGDLGQLSADGYVSLMGRIKELINRGGEKISPHEIEDALLAHPAVVDAVAFPAPDSKYGESVGAAAVLSEPCPVNELLAHCSDRLAEFKVPGRIEVVDAIPKGPTGKVQRRLMAELFEG